MYDNELLNRRKFKNKFYKDIEEGIIIKFQKIYPNNKIFIKYESENETYKFFIYINGQTISKKDGSIIDTNIFVDSFDNLIAIDLFAIKYNLNDFNKEYNQYSEENHNILKNEINKLVEEYSKLGIIFTDIKIETYNFRISYYHPSYSKKTRDLFSYNHKEKYIEQIIHKNFSIYPISKSTMNSVINSVKRSLEYFIKNSIANKLES